MSEKLLTIDEAIEYMGGGIAPQTLATWRMKGTGPRYVKIGRKHVRYRESALLEYIESQERASTAKR